MCFIFNRVYIPDNSAVMTADTLFTLIMPLIPNPVDFLICLQ